MISDSYLFFSGIASLLSPSPKASPGVRAFQLVLALIWVGSLTWVSPAFSTTAPANGANGQSPSLEQIETGRKEADTDTTLTASEKQKALELYDRAAHWLQQALELQDQVRQLKRRISEAPQRIDAIRSGKMQIKQGMSDIDAILASGDLERLELALTEEELALRQARETQKSQSDTLAELLVGSKGLSEKLTTQSNALDQADANRQSTPSADPANLAKAHNLAQSTRRLLLQTEVELLKLRLGNHDLLTNLAQTERDFAAAEATERQRRLEALSKSTQKLREERARNARQEAEALQAQTLALPKALQLIAQENANYRQELEALVRREQSVSNLLQAARLGLDEIKNEFERTEQRVEVVGASKAIGNMLKRRRAELPSLQKYQRTSAERREQISRATDRQIEIDELLRERRDIRSVVARTLEEVGEAGRSQFEPPTTELARARRDALNELQKVYGRYIGQTTALDLAERQLVEVSSAYIEYIDDQLVWTPGHDITTLFHPAAFAQAVAWLVAPNHWAETALDLRNLAQSRPLPLLAILTLFLVLFSNRKRATVRLREIARETLKIRTDSFRLTLMGLVHTLVIIGAWPLLLIGIGGLMARLPTASLFTHALGDGLTNAGTILFSLRLLIQICLPEGLGERHLRWPTAVCQSVAHEFGWLLPLAVPLGFVVAATTGNELPQQVQLLGQLAFIVIMLAAMVFVYRLLRGDGALIQAANDSQHVNLIGQLHFLWFPPFLLLPLALAITTALGYHHAAVHLEQRAEQTFWFFVGLFLLKELLLRSLYIAERRLRFEDALRRREELRVQRAQSEEAKEEEPPLVPLEIPELDFNELSEQNKRLVRAGFLFSAVIGIWSIWGDLLPALGFLNSTELPFHATRIVDGVSKAVPVTLGDLILGLVMVLITVLAAKNIPGVLEITLLQRLPLDAGARYAITSLFQYTIAGIGVVVAFSTLGLQWSNIQWLVAALSVGLGFGLQEIVANFISGIILLFERPIRVGDVVTVDNITGVVSRIRIRATTITNWDKQELLIPNKEFITGRVINWTLTDKTNRVIIPVGVAYGTDVQRAMDLMLQAAQEDENVLDDPKPIVSFDAFGDNALTLQLRCYLGSMENRLITITALHQAINDKFAEAGINIAFPQRDVHLTSDKPLEVRLHPSSRGTPTTAAGLPANGPDQP